jgi:hypothetical protein
VKLAFEPGLVVREEHVAERLGGYTVTGELVLQGVLLGACLFNYSPLARMELDVAWGLCRCRKLPLPSGRFELLEEPSEVHSALLAL